VASSPSGIGSYRRAILIRLPRPGVVEAALEDDFHAFTLRLLHDGRQVTDIESRTIRYPVNTCPEAGEVLKAAIGAPLSTSILALKDYIAHKKNCTHLYDLASLCIVQSMRAGERERRYEITIPDPVEDCTTGTVSCNGQPLLALVIEHGQITAPAHHAGQNIFRGYAGWAAASLEGEGLEAALLLQRGFLVSGARRHKIRNQPVIAALDTTMPRGVCHSTLPAVMAVASTCPWNSFDFSEAPEQLLRWVT
jgi:Protein of unknown function (DUF2889)